MKINIGCGNDIRQGFVNCDFRELHGVDKVIDISKPLPFDNDSAEYILANDILEHFSFRDTEKLLMDWKRVLSPTGYLEIQVPNIEAHIKNYYNDIKDQRYKNGYDDAMEFFRACIFGGQDYSGNFHKTCFTPNTIRLMLEKLGFKIHDLITRHRAIIVICRK